MNFSSTPAVYPRVVELPLHPGTADPGTGWYIELSQYVSHGWYHTEEAAWAALRRLEENKKRERQIPLPL